jgi:hypothetical protein
VDCDGSPDFINDFAVCRIVQSFLFYVKAL